MKLRKLLTSLLSLCMIVSMFAVGPVKTKAAETLANTNLALNKTVTASAAYGSMPASYLTDADEDSRWSTEADAVQWAYVDLGNSYNMNKFQMIWESEGVYASSFNIYVSDDTTNWGSAVATVDDNTSKTSIVTLDEAVSGRYVKLEVTAMHGYPSVSCRDLKVLYVDANAQDPTENVALNKTAVASSIEADSVRAALAVDGNTTARSSRWGSNIGNGPDWIYVDLGDTLNVNVIKIFWENRKATAYKIQIADTEGAPTESDWVTVKTFTERPASINEKIVLDEVYQARYVRLYIDSHTAVDPDGGVEWNTVSIYEMEVYGGNPKTSITDVMEAIQVETPSYSDTKLNVILPEEDDYEIIYNGTDFEQVIDDELNIIQPVVDKKVKVSFKITDKESGTYRFKEVEVTVPGQQGIDETDNPAPAVLPELAEWKGLNGNFTLTETSKVIYADDILKDSATALAEDYKDLCGKTLSVVKGTESDVNEHDIYFALSDGSKGLGKEGYYASIQNKLKVEAETSTGAYWATRTILQALKLNDFTSIPQGITRDYPLYEIRGLILDVGRKTFTMDYLEQIVNELSWYKMNDFQIHLNDNYIFLEGYSNAGLDPMNAYSGFRLESDIKEGGNNGLNQADLTSKDVYYTKDEFRNLIQEARTKGVNIVPEIDTPAHSLALTKVRPDLRIGTYGRQNDHLNLTTKYDDSLEFVQSIFSEYMTETDPVFDLQTTVHIGADEYSASSVAYRKFVNDMIDFVESSGRTARVWGSFTAAAEGEKINAEGVEINLWNFGYANMDKMYEDGFDLINCNDGQFYIVPNAGYYYDYLYDGTVYNNAINSIGGVTIPAGDKQMKGGAFAVWNDMCDQQENGMSEYDIYHRIQNSLGLYAANAWGKGTKSLSEAKALAQTLGDAPQTNFGYEVDSLTDTIVDITMDDTKDASNNGYDLVEGENASIKTVDFKKALELNGATSYMKLDGLTTAGLNNDLRVKVKRTSTSTEEQILFESPYGAIKAVQKETGKVGLSRENHDYSFDYELPVNEWVELEFKNQQNIIQLYVNGELVDTLGNNVRGQLKATMMFPLEYVGSTTNAFIGYVDDIRLTKNADFNSTMELDYAVLTAHYVLEENANDELTRLVEQAEALIQTVNPAQEDIDALVEAINAILENTDYKEADYSRVDAYLALVPTDKSVFTAESIENLEYVISTIRRNLPASMQSNVDAYEIALANALQALVIKTEADVNYIDNSTITVTASSYQGGTEPAKAIDNDTDSMWHSNWNITTMPHWIDFEMSTPQSVNGISYLPRQTGGSNGTATKYEIQISNDGTTYTTIKSGSLNNDRSEKVITFDAVTTKHVRFVFVEAVNNNASAAEFKLHNATVTADIEGLQAAIERCEGIVNSNYTEASWNALQDKIAEAKELLASENPDANDIEIMKKELAKAAVSLVLDERQVDTSDLAALYDQYKGTDGTNYTTESYAALEEALAEAKNVLDKDDPTDSEVADAIAKLSKAAAELEYKAADYSAVDEAIAKAEALDPEDYKDFTAVENAIKAVVRGKNITEQDAVDAMAKAIEDAIAALEENEDIPWTPIEPSKVNKTDLDKAIDDAKAINTSKYTEESVAVLEKALADAEKVLADKEATQTEVNAATAKLNSAIKGLVEKTTDPEEPVDPEDPTDPTEPTDPEEPTEPTDPEKPTEPETPVTNDNNYIAVFIILLVISAAVILFFVYKNRKNK